MSKLFKRIRFKDPDVSEGRKKVETKKGQSSFVKRRLQRSKLTDHKSKMSERDLLK